MERAFGRLEDLESRSIYILREAYACFKNLAMLWSIGKDSTVLLGWLENLFRPRSLPPHPYRHLLKIPEMIAYRDRFAKQWKLQLIVGKNEAALNEKRLSRTRP